MEHIMAMSIVEGAGYGGDDLDGLTDSKWTLAG
jgi:hypothetical protein